MAMLELVDPTAPEAAPPAGLQPAARRHFSRPIRITLIDNGKPKARQLLGFLAQELAARIPVASTEVYAKGSASRVIDDEEIEQLRSRSDVVIAGLGDCGACSACSLGDAIKMEAAGVPATVVISDVFTGHIASFAATMGMPGYHMAVVPHPVYSKDDATLQSYARAMADSVAVQLQGS